MCLTSAILHHAAKHNVFDTSSLFFILIHYGVPQSEILARRARITVLLHRRERFVCGAVIGKQIEGENIKSIAFIWLLFKMLILAKQLLLILFCFSLSLCVKEKPWASAYSRQNTIIHSMVNNWFWASIRKRSLSQMRIYGNERCISHPILHLYSRNEKGWGEASPRITAVIICHSRCMTTHVNSEFSFSFPWRHDGWKKQITWKCVSKRCWNCNLFFFVISLFNPSRAWTAQPISSISLCYSRTSSPSCRQSKSGFSCGSCPAILLLLLDKR